MSAPSHNLNLQPVTGRPLTYTCVGCGQSAQSDRETVYADLDGERFKAYYCSRCATTLPADPLVKSKGRPGGAT